MKAFCRSISELPCKVRCVLCEGLWFWCVGGLCINNIHSLRRTVREAGWPIAIQSRKCFVHASIFCEEFDIFTVV